MSIRLTRVNIKLLATKISTFNRAAEDNIKEIRKNVEKKDRKRNVVDNIENKRTTQ